MIIDTLDTGRQGTLEDCLSRSPSRAGVGRDYMSKGVLFLAPKTPALLATPCSDHDLGNSKSESVSIPERQVLCPDALPGETVGGEPRGGPSSGGNPLSSPEPRWLLQALPPTAFFSRSLVVLLLSSSQ